MLRGRTGGARILLMARMAAVTAALTAGSAVTLHAQIQEYEGAAKIGNLNRVTVVYPAAKAAQGALNRDSAVLRASYLRERYGVETEVAADDAVTDEQLQGHLLVLGWGNGLLGTEKAPHPYTRGPEGLAFLGGDPVRPTDDLLFVARSPYNPARYLTFWSRIDPERDRLLAFPFVGSDWAIYRDYFILQQGMFEDGRDWPPTRNPFAEHEEPVTELPVIDRSEHYVLRAATGDVDGETARQILAAREQALAQAARILRHEPPEGFSIELRVYPDHEVKYAQSGVTDPAHSLALRRELFMTRPVALDSNPHEDLHVLAGAVLGPCYLTAIFEGIAVARGSELSGNSLGAHAALLVEQKAVPDIALLLDDERFRKFVADRRVGFSPAGLFVEWIEASAGAEAMDALYGLQRGEARAELSAALDVEPDRLDAAFAEWLRGKAAESQTELAYRRALAEAQERSRVGDFQGRAEALARALEIRPGNPELAYQIGLSQVEAGLYDEAEALFEKLISESDPEKPTWVLTFSHYQLGRVHAFRGEVEQAAERYRTMLTLADEHGAHRLAREGLAEVDATD